MALTSVFVRMNFSTCHMYLRMSLPLFCVASESTYDLQLLTITYFCSLRTAFASYSRLNVNVPLHNYYVQILTQYDGFWRSGLWEIKTRLLRRLVSLYKRQRLLSTPSFTLFPSLLFPSFSLFILFSSSSALSPL